MSDSLQIVKAMIRSILVSSSEPLTANQFQRDYQKINGQPLEYGIFGYETLKAFLQSMPDVVQMTGYGHNILIRGTVIDSNRHVDELVRKNKKRHHRTRHVPFENVDFNDFNEEPEIEELSIMEKPSNDNDSDTVSEPMPVLDSNDPIFFINYPPDAVWFASDIPDKDITQRYVQQDMFAIIITERYSPYKFWFNCHDGQLSELTNDLNQFYNNLPDEELQMSGIHLYERRACAVMFSGSWCRGEIVNGESDLDGLIKIYLVDYGTVFRAYPMDVKYLMQPFNELPRQAIRGRMAYIEPTSMQWLHDAVKCFTKLTNNLVLKAQCYYVDQENKTYYLELFNTSPKIQINIGTEMVKQGFAHASSKKGKRGLAIRYPTFKMLEEGTVPTSQHIKC